MEIVDPFPPENSHSKLLGGGKYDVVIFGVGLRECLLAALLIRNGIKELCYILF